MGSGEGRVQRGEWVRAAAGCRGVWDVLGGHVESFGVSEAGGVKGAASG